MARVGPQPMRDRVFYTLRIASAMCFIGHGVFGIITKKVWLNYLAVFGVGPDLGYQLMPVVGTADILFGISLLLYPTRAVLGWLVVWGTTTALLRPLSGEPLAEAVERAGNYGAPFVLLALCESRRGIAGWLSRLRASEVKTDADTARQVALYLRIIVFMLLAGHGLLNLIGKQGLVDQYASLGIASPMSAAHMVGAFECCAALAILIKPVRSVVLALFVWKIASELFYPKWEIFEWIERGGSYGTLLALWMVLPQPAQGPARVTHRMT